MKHPLRLDLIKDVQLDEDEPIEDPTHKCHNLLSHVTNR